LELLPGQSQASLHICLAFFQNHKQNLLEAAQAYLDVGRKGGVEMDIL